MWNYICSLISVFAGVMLFALPVAAPKAELSSIGVVESITGSASVERNGELESLGPGDQIFLHDTVLTYEDSALKVHFVDETEIALADSSSVLIDEYVYNAENSDEGNARFDFLNGSFRYFSGHLAKAKEPRITLHTKWSVIGIRGTKVWGGMIDDQHHIFTEEGHIEVKNEHGTVHLKHGEGTRIEGAHTAPVPAEVWKEKMIIRIKGQHPF